MFSTGRINFGTNLKETLSIIYKLMLVGQGEEAKYVKICAIFD